MSNHLIHSKHRKTPHRCDWYALWPVWALCAGFFLLVVFGMVREYVTDLPKKSDVPVVVLGHDRDLDLDPTKLRPSELHLFEASVSGQKVKFIVERTKNNTIYVALASCKACYHNRDSHYASKGQMMCGKCKEPMTFESASQQATRTSCALPEIRHKETDQEVTVLTSDVLAQAATALQ